MRRVTRDRAMAAATSSPSPRGLLERRERRIEVLPGRRLRRDGRSVVVTANAVTTVVVAAVVVVVVVRLALLQRVTATGSGRRYVGRRRGGRRSFAHNGVDAEPGGRLFHAQPTAAGHHSGRVRRLNEIAVLVQDQRGRLRRLVRGRSGGRRRGHLSVVQQVQTERYAGQFGGRQL